MRGGDGDEMGFGKLLFTIFFILLFVAFIGVQIYFNVTFFKNIQALQGSTSEIKSKIGSLVRDINMINSQEYHTDVVQQENINKISMRLGM